MRSIETLMQEGADAREIIRLRAANTELRKQRDEAIDQRCVLSDQQMLAIYYAARWVLNTGDLMVKEEMRSLLGKNWKVPLRRGIAVMSGVLARAKYPSTCERRMPT